MTQEPRGAPRLTLSLLGRSGEVPEKSGLNWWNAGGRVRNPDEVYVALPAAALGQANLVFGSDARGTTFLARMHDGTEMCMRLEGEQGSDRSKAKQISSDASKAEFGRWILRSVLGLPYGELATRQTLEEYGRTDIYFIREGLDPLTGEVIVRMDFAPYQVDDVQVEVDRLWPTTTGDIEGMQLEEAEPDYEGAVRQKFVNYYERQPRLRARAVALHGTICKGCGFNFRELYGERGADYIEVHHLKPISSLGGAELVDPKTDMTVLCANCHRIVHRRTQVLTLEELRELVGGRRVIVVDPEE